MNLIFGPSPKSASKFSMITNYACFQKDLNSVHANAKTDTLTNLTQTFKVYHLANMKSRMLDFKKQA